MKARFPRCSPVALAAMLALSAPAVLAQAQKAEEAKLEAAEAKPAEGQDRVIITGTSTLRSKFKQSVSVSSLTSEDITSAPVNSAAELLRAIPGVRSESTGGEGNANLTIRGVPLSAGGARYVQFQEDGLPVLLVGDISFGTAESFLRADYFTDSVDVVRGGSASTLATNSPGGLINFISNTGKGGSNALGFTLGLDHRHQRADFNVSTRLGAKTWLAVGGFQRTGQGTRNTDITVEDGGQVRLSLLHEFGQGSYVRATLKHLDDRTPAYMPVPVRVVNGTVESLPGIDPRRAFFINSNFPEDVVRDRNGNFKSTSPRDGIHVKSDAFGIEARINLGDGLSITERFRSAKNSGGFISPFPAGAQPSSYTGTTPVFSTHVFNTSLDDLGNQFNDLRVQKQIGLGADQRLTVTGGLFTGRQNIFQTWYWNRYNTELVSDGARLFDNSGRVTTSPVAQGATWGFCCYRNQQTTIDARAPYAALTYDAGPLSLDASVRWDKQDLTGFYIYGNANNTALDPATRTVIRAKADATASSFGANYELSSSMAGFARYSNGHSWASPDRTIVDANAVNVANGTLPVPINKTRQIEAGLKFRQPGLNASVTVFDARTKEDGGVEITSRTYLKDNYVSRGIEAEADWRLGALRLAGGLTLTDAKISGGANDGKKPRRQAPVMAQLSPSWNVGAFEVGAQVIATAAVYADNGNTVKLPAFTVVNAFANFEVTSGLTLSVGVNNLLNTIGFTEGEGQDNGCCVAGGKPVYIARSVNGRSAKATLRYTF